MASTYDEADRKHFCQQLWPKVDVYKHAIELVMQNGNEDPNGVGKANASWWKRHLGGMGKGGSKDSQGTPPDVADVGGKDRVTFGNTRNPKATFATYIKGATEMRNKYMEEKEKKEKKPT
ncbi:MAG: hypothetical protein Q9162_001459 [Coniocarpon cinnabarinum]